jgi:hypothetical protein
MKLGLLRTEKPFDTFRRKVCTPGIHRLLDIAGRLIAQSPNPASRSMKSTLASKEMSDLAEELLALLDMREMCRVLISDPLNLGDIVKKGLHCAFLNILFRPSDEQRGCFDPMKKMYGGPVLQ